ncbi:MAG: fasciclin domain-containing protein [Steroidobacteraceae bacterium]
MSLSAEAIARFASLASRIEQPRGNNVYSPRAPHTLDIARILRALSRIRAELVGEFSLAIRRGSFMDRSNSVPTGEAARNTNTAPTKNIVDTVIDAGHFRTFAAAINAAGLTVELAAKGPFTVFAPTDEAFKKLPAGAYDNLLKDAGKLKAVLNYHVVSGYLMARDLKSGELATAQGTSLTAVVSSSDVRVNGARITKADIVATNGIVHAMDTVILPKNWQLLAAAA